MLRQLRSWNWYRLAIWAFGLVSLGYMVVVPAVMSVVEAMQPAKVTQVLSDEMSLSEKVRLRSMEAMTGLVFFALGSTIGSFLNVVVFRMPRGESVVFRSSRCPQCETEIKGRDNVPIFGWLLLNGRCRACQIPISSRYPIVETIMATMFLLLFFVELISGGANLPVRKPNFYHGVVWIIFYTKWDLITIYFFHCFCLSTLLTWALVDVDRQRIPWWASCSVGGVLLAVAAMAPDVLPVPWQKSGTFGLDAQDAVSAIQSSIIGGVCSAALAGLALLAFTPRIPFVDSDQEVAGKIAPPARGHILSAGTLVGMSVGWQASIGIWLIVLALKPLISWVAIQWKVNFAPATVALLIAYLIHLVCWRTLTVDWLPSYETTLVAWSFWCVGFVSMCLATRLADARLCRTRC